MTAAPMKTLLLLAGLGQLALAVGSLAVPRVLRWSEDTARLRPLTRQVFWTYAAYIWVTNICFGVVSTALPDQLLDGSPLSRVVTGFITVYWGARVLVQFFYFDRSEAPPGLFYKLAEVALVGLFIFLTAVYGCAAVS
ncbi:MAG: hypothetical protein ABW123_24545 [Cystobacter sp.]